ncbi:MAG: AlpA family phage regulatory protein [Methylococcales bacterium]
MAPLSTFSPTTDLLLRRPVVLQLTGKSKSAVYRDISKGLFPKPVSIGGAGVAWLRNEIASINQARITGRSDEEIKQLVIDLEESRKSDDYLDDAAVHNVMNNQKSLKQHIIPVIGYSMIQPITDEFNKVVDGFCVPIIAFIKHENGLVTPVSIFQSFEDGTQPPILIPSGKVFDAFETEYSSIQDWINSKNDEV